MLIVHLFFCKSILTHVCFFVCWLIPWFGFDIKVIRDCKGKQSNNEHRTITEKSGHPPGLVTCTVGSPDVLLMRIWDFSFENLDPSDLQMLINPKKKYHHFPHTLIKNINIYIFFNSC